MTNKSNNNQPHEMKNTKKNSKSERHGDLHGNPKSRKNQGWKKPKVSPLKYCSVYKA